MRIGRLNKILELVDVELKNHYGIKIIDSPYSQYCDCDRDDCMKNITQNIKNKVKLLFEIARNDWQQNEV